MVFINSVDSSKEMLGTYSPQPEPYTHMNAQETTPSGIFARGSYSARSKVCSIPRLYFKVKKCARSCERVIHCY